MATLTQNSLNALSSALKSKLAAGEIDTALGLVSPLSAAEVAFVDGAVAGTPAAGKAVIAGTNLAIGTIGATTIDTSRALTVTTADMLTVGGNIIPQTEVLFSGTIGLHASKVTYNLFVASEKP